MNKLSLQLGRALAEVTLSAMLALEDLLAIAIGVLLEGNATASDVDQARESGDRLGQARLELVEALDRYQAARQTDGLAGMVKYSRGPEDE